LPGSGSVTKLPAQQDRCAAIVAVNAAFGVMDDQPAE
jgi:hypothetical protein